MITNKDISIDSENGKITLNGNKYDLGTQGEIDTAVKDVYSVMGQNGAKNLIPYPYVNTTQTINNVNFTDNGDGSISADNAASEITQFRLYGWTTGLSPLLLRKGTYILSGCPSGGGINSLRLYIHNQDSSFTAIDDGEGTQFTLSDDTYVGIAIRVANGYDADGKTVYPMLRLASDTDDTYQPYAMTNKQLTDQVATKQNALTVTDISSQATVVDTYVSEYKAYTYGKLLYLILALKPGVSDQTEVVSGLPNMRGLTGVKGVMPMFYMNTADAGSNGVCAISSNKIEFRGTTTSGTNGTVFSGMFILE